MRDKLYFGQTDINVWLARMIAVYCTAVANSETKDGQGRYRSVVESRMASMT